MIRLWHPMKDPHHCTFRILTLLTYRQDHTLGKAKLSLLDLFLLFPHYLNDISLPDLIRRQCRDAGVPKKKESFVHLPDLRLIYRELQQYQKTALVRLVGKAIISHTAYENNEISLVENSIPAPLMEHIETRITKDEMLLDLIANQIASLPLEGPDSLLRKTGLEMGGKLL